MVLICFPTTNGACQVAQLIRDPLQAGDPGLIPGSGSFLEEGQAPHTSVLGLVWWLSGEEATCSAGDLDSIPGLGRSPGGGRGNPLQCSCLENPMDRGAWRAAVHGVTMSWTRLSDYARMRAHTHTHTHTHTRPMILSIILCAADHLCLFGELSTQILCPSFNRIFFLMFSCANSSYSLPIRHLLGI